jgi:hypothetical protein
MRPVSSVDDDVSSSPQAPNAPLNATTIPNAAPIRIAFFMFSVSLLLV